MIEGNETGSGWKLDPLILPGIRNLAPILVVELEQVIFCPHPFPYFLSQVRL